MFWKRERFKKYGSQILLTIMMVTTLTTLSACDYIGTDAEPTKKRGLLNDNEFILTIGSESTDPGFILRKVAVDERDRLYAEILLPGEVITIIHVREALSYSQDGLLILQKVEFPGDSSRTHKRGDESQAVFKFIKAD